MRTESKSKSRWLYDMRWPLSAAMAAVILTLFVSGWGRVATFSAQVDTLEDNPPAVSEPKIFDARYDIWFDPEDPGLQLYKRIEDQFVAEDFVLVAFTEPEHPLGVFAPASLATIAEVTKRIERIPYVRHVRSLTSNPWIRWGAIESDAESGVVDEGLLITDLFEGDPRDYAEDEIVERAVAVLGAERAIGLLGEERVVRVIGAGADRSDLIGEPRLIGNVISEDGRTTAFQVQLLRPRLSEEQLAAAFGDDSAARIVGRSMHGNQAQWRALHEIEDTLEELGGDYEFHIAGMPPVERNFMETGQEDMVMVLYMFGAIIVVMFALFRRVAAVITPLVIIFSSIFGMLGSIWLLGDLLNNITAGAPNMVTAISIADAIHLIAAYYGMRHQYDDKAALITEVIRRNALPVFLTSVTTAIGFFSLTAGNIIPLHMLGYTAGIGTVFAWLTSMTFVPAVLSLLPLPKPTGATVEAGPRRPTGEPDAHWSTPLVARVLAWRTPIVAASLVVTVLAVIGVARIELDSDFRTMFPEDNRTMVDMDWIESRLGGSGDLEIVFEAPARDESSVVARARQARIEALRTQQLGAREMPGEFEPLAEAEREELQRLERDEADFQRRRIAVSSEFLSKLRQFGDRLRDEMRDESSPLCIVTRIDGALDVLRKMSQVQNQNRSAFYRPPTEADVADSARQESLIFDEITEEVRFVPAQDASTLAAQYFLQYENGAKPAENLETLISADRRTVRLQGRVRQASSLEQQAAFERIREIAHEEFPELAAGSDLVEVGQALSSMTLSGKTLLYAGMSDKFSKSFVFSMTVALSIITLLIMVIYRSVIIGVLSIVPNVLPIFIPIGLFGLMGWEVDGPAVFVSSVALGICVDDTIHFFTKFTRARKRGLPTDAALRAAFHEVGNALTYTTIILVLGFAVLAFSQFAPNSMMGKLAAVMIGLAWVADFIVTPALLTLLPDPNAETAVATADVAEDIQEPVTVT